jgi:hypothetical protein
MPGLPPPAPPLKAKPRSRPDVHSECLERVRCRRAQQPSLHQRTKPTSGLESGASRAGVGGRERGSDVCETPPPLPGRAGPFHAVHGLRCAREDAGCAPPVATALRPVGAKKRGSSLHPWRGGAALRPVGAKKRGSPLHPWRGGAALRPVGAKKRGSPLHPWRGGGSPAPRRGEEGPPSTPPSEGGAKQTKYESRSGLTAARVSRLRPA